MIVTKTHASVEDDIDIESIERKGSFRDFDDGTTVTLLDIISLYDPYDRSITPVENVNSSNAPSGLRASVNSYVCVRVRSESVADVFDIRPHLTPRILNSSSVIVVLYNQSIQRDHPSGKTSSNQFLGYLRTQLCGMLVVSIESGTWTSD